MTPGAVRTIPAPDGAGTPAAPGLPPSKLSGLRALFAAGDHRGAIGVAAKFGRLGAERDAILSAWGAIQNPRLYRQLGKDPDALVAAGIAALVAKYRL